MLVLTHTRHCLYAPHDEALPALPTMFLAHAVTLVGQADHVAYPLVMRFLLQRSVLDMRDVPMLYGLLYSTGDDVAKERRWLVKFLAEGLVRTQVRGPVGRRAG